VAEIATALADHPALFVLDAVTSLGGMCVDVDEWGVDVCYSGTQKCLSVPPGLSPITFSARAMDAVRDRRTPVQSWYLDVTMLERYWGSERVYHHTAPVAMLAALDAGLGRVLEEGLENCWARHERLGALLGKGLVSRGFSYVAPEEARLPMLHCVRLPEGVDDASTRTKLLTEYGIEIGGGYGPFRGECWRVGLMGYTCTERNVLTFLAALDDLVRR
jgi:alanine-glyoxylate transaminase/serine-glyoxylate transaminase/serine-pyruvate transaminase